MGCGEVQRGGRHGTALVGRAGGRRIRLAVPPVVSLIVSVVLVDLDGHRQVVGRVDGAHETIDPQHESRGQEHCDAGPD